MPLADEFEQAATELLELERRKKNWWKLCACFGLTLPLLAAGLVLIVLFVPTALPKLLGNLLQRLEKQTPRMLFKRQEELIAQLKLIRIQFADFPGSLARYFHLYRLTESVALEFHGEEAYNGSVDLGIAVWLINDLGLVDVDVLVFAEYFVDTCECSVERGKYYLCAELGFTLKTEAEIHLEEREPPTHISLIGRFRSLDCLAHSLKVGCREALRVRYLNGGLEGEHLRDDIQLPGLPYKARVVGQPRLVESELWREKQSH